jgi:hypothetical protein
VCVIYEDRDAGHRENKTLHVCRSSVWVCLLYIAEHNISSTFFLDKVCLISRERTKDDSCLGSVSSWHVCVTLAPV